MAPYSEENDSPLSVFFPEDTINIIDEWNSRGMNSDITHVVAASMIYLI